MFQKEIMIAEIAHLIERIYGHHYSPQTVSNMTQAMNDEVYPHARYQMRLDHMQRSLRHKVRKKDRSEVCDDFKHVYRAETVEEALQARERFIKSLSEALANGQMRCHFNVLRLSTVYSP